MVNIVSISDIHQGRNRISPETIPNHLRESLYPHLTNDIDILCIAGDFFDRPLFLGSPASYEAIQIIHELVALAEEHDFLIRVLRGTILHDRRQNWYFTIPSTTDDRYGNQRVAIYDTIEVEFIKGHDLSMLYIPDDLAHPDIMQAISNKMASCGIQSVDLCMHHGYFNFLLPKNIPHRPHNTLNEDMISSIVNGVVMNGHVHTPDICGIVVNNGSFDRLAHNEEEKKGFFKIRYDKKQEKATFTFIENKNATIFHTIDIRNNEIEVALKRIRAFIDKYNNYQERVFLRIIDGSPIKRQAVKKLVSKCGSIVIDYGKDKSKSVVDTDYIHSGIELPMITPDNLPKLVKDHCTKQDVHLSINYITEKLNE